jgi:hypothetical protein
MKKVIKRLEKIASSTKPKVPVEYKDLVRLNTLVSVVLGKVQYRCYIVDEDDWKNTYEDLRVGLIVECAIEAKSELERLIEEFDDDLEDYQDDLDKLDRIIADPLLELDKTKTGYKPFYCAAPLGYTISIE